MKENLIGNVYGRLVVIECAPPKILPSGAKQTMWLCKCECGNIKTIPAYNLKIGKAKSCGCLSREMASQRRKTHGATQHSKRTRLYDIWRGMKERCQNPKNISYANYGGKGIRICETWNSSFEQFKEWAEQNGYSDNLSIDRIDARAGYFPDNCRWVTKRVQNNNTNRNAIITASGKTQTLAEWARQTQIDAGTISARIKKLGWSVEKALSTPTRGKAK